MNHWLTLLESCELCPRRCRVNRLKGQRGYCRIADKIIIAYYGNHFGEEPPISGVKGSGNIFFSSCNMRCIFCQNYQISHGLKGREFSIDELVDIFFELEDKGCHNINLVSPTPYVPMILCAIEKAKKRGLKLPFVYNTNAYENVETIRLLNGYIDIFLPDFKYWNPAIALKLSDAKNYPEHAAKTIVEMKKQVGDLTIKNNIAEKGLIIRHLVLPNNLAGSRQILKWILLHLGNKTFLSLMSQYYPLHDAYRYPMINRRIKEKEYEELIDFLLKNGFENVFIQDVESASLLIPDFELERPFNI
ncbi:MAG: radical SAM protein [Syntrophorhabdaceae bacterium]|nr:radical SAM protein [Syntrophorhabdaceae bacterium]